MAPRGSAKLLPFLGPSCPRQGSRGGGRTPGGGGFGRGGGAGGGREVVARAEAGRRWRGWRLMRRLEAGMGRTKRNEARKVGDWIRRRGGKKEKEMRKRKGEEKRKEKKEKEKGKRKI